MGFSILFLVTLLQFIPFPKLPFIEIAPINLFFYVGALYVVLNLRQIFALNQKVIVILISLLGYFLVEHPAFFLQHNDLSINYENIRDLVYILLITIVCTKIDNLVFFSKMFVTLTFFSTLYGMLVYFVGGPFLALKSWLVQSMSTSAMTGGVSTQLTGLAFTAFIFGYLMASAPVLCQGLYTTAKRFYWLLMLLVLLVGVLLNAERSALLLNLVVFYFFLKKTNRNPLKIIGFSILVFCIMSLAIHAAKMVRSKDFGSKSQQAGVLTERVDKTSIEEVLGRLAWQIHGIETVLRYPIFGATKEQYEEIVRSHGGRGYIPFPHNAYINTGIKIGVLGWFIAAYIIYAIRRMHVEAARLNARPEHTILFYSISLALFGALGNAFFHNSSIFTGDFATLSLLGYFISMHHLATRQIREIQ